MGLNWEKNKKFGEDNFNSKLNREQVIEMLTTNTCHYELAKKFNVSAGRIRDIRDGKGWLHIWKEIEENKKPRPSPLIINKEELPRGV